MIIEIKLKDAPEWEDMKPETYKQTTKYDCKEINFGGDRALITTQGGTVFYVDIEEIRNIKE